MNIEKTENSTAAETLVSGQAFTFGEFTLDLNKGMLTKGAVPVMLRAKSFAVLAYLVRNAGRVIAKDELFDAVWNDVTVTEDSLTQCIRDIRLALEDSKQNLIKTVPRRGYMFSAAADVATALPSTHSDFRPKLAVLPFRNLDGNQNQNHVAAGITEDIIVALARFSSITVINTHAASLLSGEAEEAVRVFDATHLVDGSVRIAQGRIRITAQLRTAVSGVALWAERYERPMDDIFAIQDDVVTAITSALDTRLISAGLSRAQSQPVANWTAYEFLLKGRDLCNRSMEPQAIPFLAKAAALDPASSLAHGWHGLALAVSAHATAEPHLIAEASRVTAVALACDNHEAVAHWAMAMSSMYSGKLAEAEPHFRRAMELNPANIQVRSDHANWLRYSGLLEAALIEIESAMQQDAYAPQWFHALRGRVLFDMKVYDAALAELAQLPNTSISTFCFQASAHAWRGEREAAAAVVKVIRAMKPDLSLRHINATEPYADAAAREHLLEGLRRAGVTEG